tara:strand:- start:492 stop:902 length:411 start_codon:yes stop_codon:yes gene_type:complete
MGNYLQTDATWYVYRRSLSTDDWIHDPLQSWSGINEEDAYSQFKHEVYSFALAKHTEYEDTKAIYLYCGGQRIAKALVDYETKQVEVCSSSIRQWLASPEKLAKQRYPEHEKEFFNTYLKKHAWKNTQTVTFVHQE